MHNTSSCQTRIAHDKSMVREAFVSNRVVLFFLRYFQDFEYRKHAFDLVFLQVVLGFYFLWFRQIWQVLESFPLPGLSLFLLFLVALPLHFGVLKTFWVYQNL